MAVMLAGSVLAMRPALGLAPAPDSVRDGSSVETAQRISDLPGCGDGGSLAPAMDSCSLNVQLSGAGAAKW
jgi:hypothetical protein